MITPLLILGALTLGQYPPSATGMIEGVVVNGSADQTPMAGTEVVLRAGDNTGLIPVETSTTDANGYFVFRDLPTNPNLIYLPGANRAGVHYPGPRVRFSESSLMSQVKLVAYEAVESPSPLIAKEHTIDVHAKRGVLDITESLVIANPTRTAYVGKSSGEDAPITLALSLPDGFETVTFADEFHGRNFQVIGGKVVTSLPWPPGQRELRFTYRLPIEARRRELVRVIDLPTSLLLVRIGGEMIGSVACSLPQTSRAKNQSTFEYRSLPLAAGYQLHLELGRLPIPLDVPARWFAGALLAVLCCGIIAVVCRRQRG